MTGALISSPYVVQVLVLRILKHMHLQVFLHEDMRT